MSTVKIKHTFSKKNPNQKEVKLSLIEEEMILCRENPKDSTLKLLELTNLGKLLDTKSKIHSVSVN